MKKKRKELEEDAKEGNERIAASWKIDTELNQATKKQVDELTAEFVGALQELESAKDEYSLLLQQRTGFFHAGRRHSDENRQSAGEKTSQVPDSVARQANAKTAKMTSPVRCTPRFSPARSPNMQPVAAEATKIRRSKKKFEELCRKGLNANPESVPVACFKA
ncbi:MAG: hypothetical protein Q9175_004964 [Cornicularia normoerica]